MGTYYGLYEIRTWDKKGKIYQTERQMDGSADKQRMIDGLWVWYDILGRKGCEPTKPGRDALAMDSISAIDTDGASLTFFVAPFEK